MRLFLRCLLLPLLIVLARPVAGQWQNGDLYREYTWVTPEDGEAFLRVGGRYGYASQPDRFPSELQTEDQLHWPQPIDLVLARRAEVTIERVQSHEDSKGLRISVNGHPAIPFGLPADLPEPADEYMFHTDQTVDIPLAHLRQGRRNSFQLELDTLQRWNWPQNLLYAVTLRVYYTADKTTVAAPVIAYDFERIPSRSWLQIAEDSNFVAVDYALEADDMDWSGRGVFRRLHWQTFRSRPNRTLGSSDSAPNFPVEWDTEWLPDQQQPLSIHCRARDKEGIYHLARPLQHLELAPRPYSVALITPTEVPRNWVTRSGTFSERLQLDLDPQRVEAFRFLWNSWSPCYGNGLLLNDHLIWLRSGDCYVYAALDPVFEGPFTGYLVRGRNTVSTALTPLFNGQMVHGMEVQWPGIVMKVRYR